MKGKEVHRYNLALPAGLAQAAEQAADREGITMTSFVRRSLRVTLKLLELSEKGAEIVVRKENEPEKRIIIL